MDNPRNAYGVQMQHYLPAFHIRGFSRDSDRSTNKLLTTRRARVLFRNLDAAYQHNWIMRLDEVGVLPNFYDDLFGTSFDMTLTSIESKAARTFYRLYEAPIGSDLNLAPEDSRAILGYFASLYLRSPQNLRTKRSKDFAARINSNTKRPDLIGRAVVNAAVGSILFRAASIEIIDGSLDDNYPLPVLYPVVWDKENSTLYSIIKPNRVIKIVMEDKKAPEPHNSLVVRPVSDPTKAASVVEQIMSRVGVRWFVSPVPDELDHLRPYSRSYAVVSG